MKKEEWYTYIVECRNKSFYTGVTNNIEKRLIAHNEGRGGRYTRSFRPVKLVWKENHSSRNSASRREVQIKKWSRIKKKRLIEGKL